MHRDLLQWSTAIFLAVLKTACPKTHKFKQLPNYTIISCGIAFMCFEETVSTLGLTHKHHIYTKLAQYDFRKARYDSVSLSMVDVTAYTTARSSGLEK